jgi:hypothetical protein
MTAMSNELVRHALAAHVFRSLTDARVRCTECERTVAFQSPWCPVHKHWFESKMHRTVEYDAWRSMMSRCENEHHPQFRHYGGRGIEVCDGLTWFYWFMHVLGERPKDKTLDRTDNNGNYSCGQCDHCRSNGWPLNVRWATWKQQANNRRRMHSSLFE